MSTNNSNPCGSCADTDPESVECHEPKCVESSSANTICHDAYQNLTQMDRLAIIGTAAPNGKCLHKVMQTLGFVVSDSGGQFVDPTPRNIPLWVASNVFPRGIVVHASDPESADVEDTIMNTLDTPDDANEYLLHTDGGGVFGWKALADISFPQQLPCWPDAEVIEHAVGEDTLRVVMMNATSGTDQFCMGPMRATGSTERYLTVRDDGITNLRDIPVQGPELPPIPEEDPELYKLAIDEDGNLYWLKTITVEPAVLWSDGVDGTGAIPALLTDPLKYRMLRITFRNGSSTSVACSINIRSSALADGVNGADIGNDVIYYPNGETEYRKDYYCALRADKPWIVVNYFSAIVDAIYQY